MRGIRMAVVLAVSVLISAKAGLGADDKTTNIPPSTSKLSAEVLSRLRYQSLSLGGATIHLGMSSNEVLTAVHMAKLIDSPMTSDGSLLVLSTNSLTGGLKGTVVFYDGVAVRVTRHAGEFFDTDGGTDFAHRLFELFDAALTKEGTKVVVTKAKALVRGEYQQLDVEFNVVPGNKQFSYSLGKGTIPRSVFEETIGNQGKEMNVRPNVTLYESIYTSNN